MKGRGKLEEYKTNMEVDSGNEDVLKKDNVKKKKPGIIYLGTLPPYMNVTKVKDIFSSYGELGRVFLQPADNKPGSKSKKKKPPLHFSEGWIEFKSKRIAKMVATTLNNTQVGGKKSSKFYDYTWNIKYLPRFKWVHLSERLAYERAVRKYKLRMEIAQAKKEANFFASNVQKSKKSKKLKSAENKAFNNIYKQRQTESEILSVKPAKENDENERKKFLESLFSNS